MTSIAAIQAGRAERLRIRRGRPAPRSVLLALLGLIALTVSVPVTLARFVDTDSSSAAFTAATLQPPTGVSATGGSTATLTWTASTSSAATGYVIERATALGGPYTQIATVTPVSATGYVDSPTTGTYWYRLSTYKGNWRSVTTTPVSASVVASSTTGAKPCVNGSNAADTGGNGNGYESLPNNACAVDGSVATDANTGTNARSASCTNAANDRHRFWGYAFGLPGTVTAINGITIRADVGMRNNGGTSNVCVELSWDGGTTWTTAKSVTLTATAVTTYTLGSATDPWGHAWTAAQLSTANFRVRVTDATTQNNKDYRLDYLAVTVNYTP